MFDLTLVQALYDLQHDPTATPEEHEEAKQKIAQISDTVVEEYLSSLVHETDGGGAFLGRKKGTRKFEDYQVLYCRNCIEGQIIGEDGRTETNPPREDRIGNVLFHRKYSQQSQ